MNGPGDHSCCIGFTSPQELINIYNNAQTISNITHEFSVNISSSQLAISLTNPSQWTNVSNYNFASFGGSFNKKTETKFGLGGVIGSFGNDRPMTGNSNQQEQGNPAQDNQTQDNQNVGNQNNDTEVTNGNDCNPHIHQWNPQTQKCEITQQGITSYKC